MTSESTRFLGQPKEIKPTVGAVGWGGLVTYSLYRGAELAARPATARLGTASAEGQRRRDELAGICAGGGTPPPYICGKFLVFNSILIESLSKPLKTQRLFAES
jgi:hypothetical protein